MKAALVCAVATGSLLVASAAERTRSFQFEYTATVKNVPAGAGKVELWVPVPHDDSYQQITNVQIESKQPYKLATGPQGNEVLHFVVNSPTGTDYSVNLRFHAVRREHEQANLLGGGGLAHEDTPGNLAQYLKADRLVPIDNQIRQWAQGVVTAANAHTDLEMARAIYLHVVSTMKYDKTGKGWGRGDIYYACEERRGNCTDFHAMFIGYARAMGVPARFAIGFPLPADRGEGQIAGYHCWAEFYARGIGWVPVDASEAAKHPDRRDYFFGHHDENRVEFTRGRDLILTPPQQGDPLNFFVYPYAEVDGKAFQAEYVAKYRDDAATEAAAVQR